MSGACVLPLRYPPGTILDSLQRRRVLTNTLGIAIPVGATIQIPENFRKLVFTQQMKDLAIDRYFIQFGDRPHELIPVYLKIYDRDEATVLLLSEGINEFMRRCSQIPHTTTTFLKDNLYSCMVAELESLDSTLADVVREYSDMPVESSAYIFNDSAQILLDKSKNDADYPWNLCNVDSNSVVMILTEPERSSPQGIVNYLFDLYIQLDINERFGHSVLYDALNTAFSPMFGDIYTEIALDTLTKNYVEEPCVSGQYVARNMGVLLPSRVSYTSFDLKGVTYIKEFSSSLLEFCVWLHELPLHEFAFTYILPSRDRLEDLKWHRAIGRTSTPMDLRPIRADIGQLTLSWTDKPFQQLSVVKTGGEELIIDLKGPNSHKRLYIDLFFTTLLSQSLCHKENM